MDQGVAPKQGWTVPFEFSGGVKNTTKRLVQVSQNG